MLPPITYVHTSFLGTMALQQTVVIGQKLKIWGYILDMSLLSNWENGIQFPSGALTFPSLSPL